MPENGPVAQGDVAVVICASGVPHNAVRSSGGPVEGAHAIVKLLAIFADGNGAACLVVFAPAVESDCHGLRTPWADVAYR